MTPPITALAEGTSPSRDSNEVRAPLYADGGSEVPEEDQPAVSSAMAEDGGGAVSLDDESTPLTPVPSSGKRREKRESASAEQPQQHGSVATGALQNSEILAHSLAKEDDRLSDKATLLTLPQLSPDIHAAGCRMGELLLTPQELAAINQLIVRSNFRFVAEPFFPPASSWANDVPSAPKPPVPSAPAQSSQESVRPRTRASTRKSTADKVKIDTQTEDLVTPQNLVRSGGELPKPSVSASIKASARTKRETEVPSTLERSPLKGAVSGTASKKRISTRGSAGGSSTAETPPRKKRAVSSHTPVGGGGASRKSVEPPLTSPGGPRSPMVVEPPAAAVTPLPPTITEPLIVEPPKTPPIIESADATWRDAAFEVLRKLEGHPMAKCFLQPVDPIADGMPDYFQKVKTPIDLSTIRAKLNSDVYSHPFRFQTDVRQIFYNVFTYHPVSTTIWRSASELAVHFENLCKETTAINPYVIFKRPAPPKVAQAAGETAGGIIPGEAGVAVSGGVAGPGALGGVGSAGSSAAPGQPEAASSGTITMDAAQLLALLEKAAASGVVTDFDQTLTSPPATTPSLTPAPTGPGGGAAKAGSAVGGRRPAGGAAGSRRPRISGLQAGVQLPPGVTVKEGSGLCYTTECYGTPLAELYERSPPVSALPPPPPPTAAGQADSKGTTPLAPLTQSQKKSALARFKELDVTYRKALLDMMRDELGVHSLLCALDVRYLPDVDVLPVFRQRQFFVYLKNLVALQKEAQDRHFLPAALPRALDWTIVTPPTGRTSVSGPTTTAGGVAGLSRASQGLTPPGGSYLVEPSGGTIEPLAGIGGVGAEGVPIPAASPAMFPAMAGPYGGVPPATTGGTTPLMEPMGAVSTTGLAGTAGPPFKPSSPTGFPWGASSRAGGTGGGLINGSENELSDDEDGLGMPRPIGIAGHGGLSHGGPGNGGASSDSISSSSSSDEDEAPKGPSGVGAPGMGGNVLGGAHHMGGPPSVVGSLMGRGRLGSAGSASGSSLAPGSVGRLPPGSGLVGTVTPGVPSAGTLGPPGSAAGYSGGFGVHHRAPVSGGMPGPNMRHPHHPLPGSVMTMPHHHPGAPPSLMFPGGGPPTMGGFQTAAVPTAGWPGVASAAGGGMRVMPAAMPGMHHHHPSAGYSHPYLPAPPPGTSALFGGPPGPGAPGVGLMNMTAQRAPLGTPTGGPMIMPGQQQPPARRGLGLWSGADGGGGGMGGTMAGRQFWDPHSTGVGTNNLSGANPSCWPEWKGKVIQEVVVSQSRAREGVDPASDRERQAERADAPI